MKCVCQPGPQNTKSSQGRAVESLGKEAADGRREGSLEGRLKSRDDAAFGAIERAKHWTTFHVAQTIGKKNSKDNGPRVAECCYIVLEGVRDGGYSKPRTCRLIR